MNGTNDLAQKILDTALQLADKHSWESLRLHDIANEMGISLTDIQKHYRQKDARMLKASETTEFLALNKKGRLHHLIMAWLDTLSEHKTASRDMLLYKIEPAHIHLQVLGILRISMTVQWFLEATGDVGVERKFVVDQRGAFGHALRISQINVPVVIFYGAVLVSCKYFLCYSRLFVISLSASEPFIPFFWSLPMIISAAVGKLCGNSLPHSTMA